MRWFADMTGQFILGSEDNMPEGDEGIDWQETTVPLGGDVLWDGIQWVELPQQETPEPTPINVIPYIGTNTTMKKKKWEIVMTDNGVGFREKP
jgi:hypothetical protein